MASPFFAVIAAVAAAEAGGARGAGSTGACRVGAAFERLTPLAGTYDCVGTGRGVEALLRGDVDYALSDAPLPSSVRADRPDIVSVPVMGEHVALLAHLPGSARIALSVDILSAVLAGDVVQWDDPRIVRINPGAALPAEGIRVAVRADASGATATVLDALAAGGVYPAGWPGGDRLLVPTAARHVHRVAGSTAQMIDYVAATPFALGYAAAGAAWEEAYPRDGVVVAAVVTREGGVKDAYDTPALEAVLLDAPAARLGARRNDTLARRQYPFLSVRYMSMTAAGCHAMRMAAWLIAAGAGLAPPADRVLYGARGAAPLPPHMAAEALAAVQCGTEGAAVVPVDGGAFRDAARAGGLAAEEGRVVITAAGGDEEEGVPQLRVESSLDPQPDAGEDAVIPVAVGMAVLAVGVGGGLPAPAAVPVDAAMLAHLFAGNVTVWGDAFADSKGGVPAAVARALADVEVVLVEVQDGRSAWDAAAAALGVDPGDRAAAAVAVADLAEAMAYVAAHPGAVALTTARLADAWGCAVVHPIVDGVETAPDPAALRRALLAAPAAAGAPPFPVTASGQLAVAAAYPFTEVVSLVVPTTGACASQHRAAYPAVAALAAPSAAAAAAEYGYVHASDVAPAALRTALGALACDGVPVFPAMRAGVPAAGDEELGAAFYTVLAAAVVLVAVLVLVTARKQRPLLMGRGRRETAHSTLAAEVAEAVALLDFRAAEARFESLATSDLDRTELALYDICHMLKEFAPFIPHHVLVSVRRVSDVEDAADAVIEMDTSTEDTTPSKSAAATPRQQQLLTEGSDTDSPAVPDGLSPSASAAGARAVSAADDFDFLGRFCSETYDDNASVGDDGVLHGHSLFPSFRSMTFSSHSVADSGTSSPAVDMVMAPSYRRSIGGSARASVDRSNHGSEGGGSEKSKSSGKGGGASLIRKKFASVVARAFPSARFQLGLERRVVGLLTVRPAPFVASTEWTSTQFEQWQSAFLKHVLAAVATEHGVIHNVNEEAVVAVWGSKGRPLGSTHRIQLLRAATRCKDIVPANRMPHCGLKIGHAHCGSLGNETTQTFHVLGDPVHESAHLARIAQLTGAPCLISSKTLADLYGCGCMVRSFPFLPLYQQRVVCEGKDPATDSVLFGSSVLCDVALHDDTNGNTDEWMYEVVNQSATPPAAALDGSADAYAVLSVAMRDCLKAVRLEPLLAAVGRLRNVALEAVPYNLGFFVQWLCRVPLRTAAGLPVLEAGVGGTLFSTRTFRVENKIARLMESPSTGVIAPLKSVPALQPSPRVSAASPPASGDEQGSPTNDKPRKKRKVKKKPAAPAVERDDSQVLHSMHSELTEMQSEVDGDETQSQTPADTPPALPQVRPES